MARILLIENDSGLAASLARVLGATGFETDVVGEGREGLARAAATRPDGIVLSVELPDMSGYLVCQRLKKDEGLRTIPLVLTSSDATEKSFADHQKLKVRADAYLLKPFPPQTLIESLAHLVGLPERPAGEEEELVRLEDGVEDAPMPALDLDALGDEAPHAPSPHLHEDTRPAAPARDEDDLFFDSLTELSDEHPIGEAHGGPARADHPDEAGSGLELDLDALGEAAGLADRGAPSDDLGLDQPMRADDLDAAADSLPDDDPLAELGELAADDRTPAEARPLVPPEPAARPRPASADLLRAAGIKLLNDDDEEPAAPATPSPAAGYPPVPPPGATRVMPAFDLRKLAPAAPGRSAEATQPSMPVPVPGAGSSVAERVERELVEVREQLSDARAEILSRESEVRQLKEKVTGLTRRAEQAEAEVRTARTEAGEADELRARLAAAERRAEDAAGSRAEAEKRAAEAERRAEEGRSAAAAARAELERHADAERAAARQLEELRTELTAARVELEAARTEATEARARPAAAAVTAALEARVAELEAAAAKNEERVVKAYQKIRGDEKVRDKVRKALAIASQLLDEGMAPDPTAERRPAPPAPPPRTERG